jgi:hypothetical protein
MKMKILSLAVLVVIVSLVFASVAFANVSQATISAIIQDANSGTISGHWTAAEIQAALNAVATNPLYQAYSGDKDVLQQYLASLQSPGVTTGTLAFTGSNLLVVFAAGAALLGGGVLLRRRRTA